MRTHPTDTTTSAAVAVTAFETSAVGTAGHAAALLWSTFGVDCRLHDGDGGILEDFGALLSGLGLDAGDPAHWWRMGAWLVAPFDEAGLPVPLAASTDQWFEHPIGDMTTADVAELLETARRQADAGNRFYAFASQRVLAVPKVWAADTERRYRQATTIAGRLRAWAQRQRLPGVVAVAAEIFDGAIDRNAVGELLWHPDLVLVDPREGARPD